MQEVWLKCQLCGSATGRSVAYWKAECVSSAPIVQLTGLPVEQCFCAAADAAQFQRELLLVVSQGMWGGGVGLCMVGPLLRCDLL